MKYVVALLLALCLTACGTNTVIKTEIVTVDKPIPFIPKPPTIPKFESQVDKLTPADVANPGKVGQAYKYDHTFHTKLITIYEQILKQYDTSSQDFDKIKSEIDRLFEEINKSQTEIAEKAKDQQR